MQLNKTQRYPVSAAVLKECLTTRDFVEARYAAVANGAVRFDAFEKQPGHVLIRVIRSFELKAGKSMPGFAKKFANRHYDMVMEFCWTETEQSPYRCHYHFTVQGVPVKIEGDMTLHTEQGTDGQEQAVQHINLEVSCHIPVFGKKLAALLAEKIEPGLESDYRGTLKVLEDRGLI